MKVRTTRFGERVNLYESWVAALGFEVRQVDNMETITFWRAPLRLFW